MPTRARGDSALVWTRAAILGTIALALGSVSHVAAGGLLPHPVAVATLLVLTAGLASRFLRGPASTLRVVALVVAGQATVHLGLSALAGHRGDPASPSWGSGRTLVADPVMTTSTERVGSLREQYDAAVLAVASDPGPAPGTGSSLTLTDVGSHALHHLLDQGPVMLLGHTLAAVLVGLWLAVGESALWTVLVLTKAHLGRSALAVPLAAACLAAVRGALARRQLTPAARHRHLARVPQQSGHRLDPLRGPPALLAA